MSKDKLICPACDREIPSHYVIWDYRKAQCPRCDLELHLDGLVVPNTVVQGYPDNMLAPVENLIPQPGEIKIPRTDHQTEFRVGT